MQAFKYIQYFFYLLSKWDLQIARHVIEHEVKGEKKYGISTTGVDKLKKTAARGIDIDHASNYMPASYDMLELFFSKAAQFNLNGLLDIGCGKGRALCVAAHYGFRQVIGIDFSKELCKEANSNLAITKKKFPHLSSEIIYNDAFYYEIPADIDCIFLFNPFDDVILSGVIENIDRSLEEFPRDIYIIYFNPVYKQEFIEAGYKEIFYKKKLEYLDGSILKK